MKESKNPTPTTNPPPAPVKGEALANSLNPSSIDRPVFSAKATPTPPPTSQQTQPKGK